MHFSLTTTTHYTWDGLMLHDEEGLIYFVKDGEVAGRPPNYLRMFEASPGTHLSHEELVAGLKRRRMRFANPSDFVGLESELDAVVKRIDQFEDRFVEELEALALASPVDPHGLSQAGQPDRTADGTVASKAQATQIAVSAQFTELMARADVLPGKKFYTVNEVAALLQQDRYRQSGFKQICTLLRNRYCARGRVDCMRDGNAYLITWSSVEDLLNGITHKEGTYAILKRSDKRKGAYLRKKRQGVRGGY